jgi:transcriptional regulator with XRE-family HTH domain
LLGLKQTSTKLIFETDSMTTQILANYLRSHRMRSGLTQRELADLMGLIAHHQVSQHERSFAIPSFLAALSYEAVFRVPAAELFPGSFQTISRNIEERLAEMERRLESSTPTGHAAQITARKLEWLCERRNP